MEQAEINYLVKYALGEAENSKAEGGLKVAYLPVSRRTYPKAVIAGLREQLEKQGYKTRLKKGSHIIIMEW